MAITKISVRGARQHNLKNIDVEIPRNTLTVITGLSGSGKSSLAFDTIYAEGQRRYVETLSAYARQFLDQMERPDVDAIDGLSPSISIEQKTTSRSPRSTVGTITEIYDYLRLLFASIGVPHCPRCGRAITRQSAEQIVQRVMALTPEDRVMIMAPIVRGRKGEFKKEMEKLTQHGFTRARVDGELVSLEEEIHLDKRKNHTIEVVIDRLLVKPGIEQRLEMSVGLAMKLAGGLVQVAVVGGEEQLFSARLACPDCGINVPQLEPRSDRVSLEEEIHLDKRKNHTIEVVIDRLLVKPGIEQRLEMSVGLAMKLAGGLVQVAVVGGEEQLFSARLACPDCGINVPQLEPR